MFHHFRWKFWYIFCFFWFDRLFENDFTILLIFSFLSIYSFLANKLKQFAEAKSGARIKSGDIGNGNNNDAASMHSKTVNATAAFNLLQFVLNVENFLSITIIKCMCVFHI